MRTVAKEAAAFMLLAVGVSALAVSGFADRIWWVLGWFMLGMTCLSLVILRVYDHFRAWLKVSQPWWALALAIAATVVGGAVVVWSIIAQFEPVVLVLAMVLMTVGINGIFAWAAREPVGLVESRTIGANRSPRGRIGVGSETWYGFEAMAVGIGLFLISDGTATLIGAVVWFAGLVIVKIGSKDYLSSKGKDLRRTLRIMIDIALVGLFLLFAGAFGSNTVLVLLGLSVVSATLSMVGIGTIYIPPSHKRRVWSLLLSSVAMVAIWLWMTVIIQNPGLAFVLGLMIALVGGFFVLRGEGIVLLMMAAFILSWGLVDRSVTLGDTAVAATDGATIVAIGDSFISGEGAPKFFEGTNDAGGNQCRRAPTSHPYLIGEELREVRGDSVRVLSLACSGAKISDLTSCGQMWADGRRCREGLAPLPDGAEPPAPPPDGSPAAVSALDDAWRDVTTKLVDETAGQLPQLVTALGRGGSEHVETVLLSIGGNDVGFSSIVKACLLPKGCEERREIWLDSIDLIAPQLDEAYADVKVVFPNAEVYVFPYPMLVNEKPSERCDLGLSQDERGFVVDFINKLDETIAAAAGRAGFQFVANAQTAYVGAQLCDDEAAANHLRLVPPAGSKLGRYSPGTWIPGSMHPNVRGHELTAISGWCKLAEQLELDPPTGELGDGRTYDCAGTHAPFVPEDDVGDVAATNAGAGVEGVDDEGFVAAAAEATERCREELDEAEVSVGDEEAVCQVVADVVDDQAEVIATDVAEVTEDLVSDGEWIRVELFRTIRALALPLVLLLAAGMVFAWGFAQWNNPVSRLVRQQRDDQR